MSGDNKWMSRKLAALVFGGMVLLLLAYWKVDPSYAMAWGGMVGAYIGLQGLVDKATVQKD